MQNQLAQQIYQKGMSLLVDETYGKLNFFSLQVYSAYESCIV